MRQHIRRFRVRSYEQDSFGHVNNAVYANYLQEAAIEASTAAGFSPGWYVANNAGWVICQLSLRYHLQASYGDELEVSTWVSDVRRVSSTREYLITRVNDKARVARARVNWVYMNTLTNKPQRVPEEFARRVEPSGGEDEDLGIRLQKPRPIEGSFRYRTRRRVQTYELDTQQHVNNAVYLQWIEQSYFDAMRAANHPIEQKREEGWWALQGGHDMEYFEPALDNDEIEVVSHVCEMGKVRGAWTHEVYNAHTRKLLARDYSLGVFVNIEGKPVAPPQEFIEDIIRGG